MGTFSPASEIESGSLNQIAASDRGTAERHTLMREGDNSLVAPWDFEDIRQYLRSYVSHIYAFCPLEICNDSIEDVVLNTIQNKSTGSDCPQSTILCVFILLALGTNLSCFPPTKQLLETTLRCAKSLARGNRP